MTFFTSLYGEVLPAGMAIHIRMKADQHDAGSNRGAEKPVVINQWFHYDTLPDTWPQDLNVWFGVALRPKGDKRPVLWTALYADLDSAGWEEHIPEAFPPPSMAVRSGRGWHLYWLLRAPLTDAVEVRRWLRLIARRIGADPNAAEPARVLRVPGTRNVKYADPPLCEVVMCHPDRRYDVEQFGVEEELEPEHEPVQLDEIVPLTVVWDSIVFPERLAYLKPAAWGGMTVIPDHELKRWRDKSHSALILRVARALAPTYTKGQVKSFMLQSKGLMREEERRRPRDKIDLAIHRAFDQVTREQRRAEAATTAGLRLYEGCLHRMPRGEEPRGQRITNFEATPTAMFNIPGRDGGGYRLILIRQDGRQVPVTVPNRLFDSQNHWGDCIPPAFEWHGNNADLRAFKAYLNAQHPPEKTPTEILGWYPGPTGTFKFLVAANGVYTYRATTEKAPLHYAGDVPWYLTPPADLIRWREDVARVFALLLRLHEQPVVLALLGWIMSTFLAPHIRQARTGAWSGLWVWGQQGSGKTTTIKQFLRLAAVPKQWCGVETTSTLIGIQRALSSTNTVPVFIDDPRRRMRYETEREALYGMLRAVFDGSTALLANVNKRHSAYALASRELLAPTLVASEHAIENDPALEERYFYVPTHRAWIDHADSRVLNALETETLEHLAAGFYWYVWALDVQQAWREALMYAEPLTGKGAGPRARGAIAQILFGLEIANNITPILSPDLSFFQIAEMLWEHAHEQDDPGGGGASSGTETFRRLYVTILNLIDRKIFVEGQAFMKEGDVLWLIRAKMNFEVPRVQDAGLPLTESIITQTLRAYDGKFVYALNRRVQFVGKSNQPSCVGFNLSRISTELGITWEPFEQQALR